MLVCIAVIHLLRDTQEDLPDFTNTTHIFLPINDSNKPEIAESGSHWSLLLISVIDGVAYHYDSLRQGNETKAGFATGQMSVLLGKRLRFTPLEDSPLQENMSDCGVFVCLNMRHLLLRRLLMCRSDEQVNVSMAGRRVDAKEGRLEIARIIEDFRREGERRRSYVITRRFSRGSLKVVPMHTRLLTPHFK